MVVLCEYNYNNFISRSDFKLKHQIKIGPLDEVNKFFHYRSLKSF